MVAFLVMNFVLRLYFSEYLCMVMYDWCIALIGTFYRGDNFHVASVCSKSGPVWTFSAQANICA